MNTVINARPRATYAVAFTLAILHASHVFGGTIDIAANFNAPNNPNANSGFSYGSGMTPAGFSPFAASSQDANCIGISSYCEATGLPNFSDPNIEWNGTGSTQFGIYPTNMIRMDSQALGAIVRYTAPVSGNYTVASIFMGDDPGQAPVETFVFANGVGQASTTQGNSLALIVSYGGTQTYNFTTNLSAGQTLDFITVGANVSLGTTLGGTITTPDASAPEPSALSFMLLALPALAVAKRLRV